MKIYDLTFVMKEEGCPMSTISFQFSSIRSLFKWCVRNIDMFDKRNLVGFCCDIVKGECCNEF